MQGFADECLFEALMILMERKDFNAITITELTKKAGVSRTTFYRKYNSIDEIIIGHFIDMNFGLVLPESVEDFDLKKHILQYFDFMIQNKRYLEILIKANLSYKILDLLDYYCNGPCKQYLNKIGFNQRYEISAFIGLFYKMTVDWIKDGMPDPEGSIELTYNLLLSLNTNKITAA